MEPISKELDTAIHKLTGAANNLLRAAKLSAGTPQFARLIAGEQLIRRFIHSLDNPAYKILDHALDYEEALEELE